MITLYFTGYAETLHPFHAQPAVYHCGMAVLIGALVTGVPPHPVGAYPVCVCHHVALNLSGIEHIRNRRMRSRVVIKKIRLMIV